MRFGGHNIRHQRFAHTVCGLVCIIPPLQHEICVVQVTTKHCENLAMRLRVCSTIQLSPLLSWPQRFMDKLTMQVDSVPWQLTLHLGWALAQG